MTCSPLLFDDVYAGAVKMTIPATHRLTPIESKLLHCVQFLLTHRLLRPRLRPHGKRKVKGA